MIIIIDSILIGLNKYEKFVVRQNDIYKYSNGYGCKKTNTEYFTLEKFSILNERVELTSVSSIFSTENIELFEAGLKIGFNENGISFKFPDQYEGYIILPFEYFINQKKLNLFLKFLKKLAML